LANRGNATIHLIIPAELGEQPFDGLKNGFSLRTLRFVGPNKFRITPSLARYVRITAQGKAVIHCHGIWMHPQWAAAKAAHQAGCPVVVSPRGMFQPWAMKRGGARKRLLRSFVVDRYLKRCALFHALTAQELSEIRGEGLRQPVAVIPNGTDLPGDPLQAGRERTGNQFPQLREKRLCLFLSRLHPKKNLPVLLQAWASLGGKPDAEGWLLGIAGEGDAGYVQALQKQAAELRIAEKVSFLGGIYGTVKSDLLSAADCFVLPSLSEGFSMAVLEACAHAVPVVLTPGCNFPELARMGGGIEAPPTAEALAGALLQIMAMNVDGRRSMGGAGLELVRSGYSWARVAERMEAVYLWLLGEGDKPADVVL
jgi:poly(glycerol-phosphate) alpha-glucosyltransferase